MCGVIKLFKKILWIIPLVILLSTTNVYAAAFDMDLVIDQTTVTKGEDLNVKLSNKNLDDNGLASGQFYVEYDTNYYNFSCDDVTYKQNVASSEIDCNVSNNQIIVMYVDEDAGDSPITNGEFLNLKFNVKTGVTTTTPTTFKLSGEGFSSVNGSKIVNLTSNSNITKTVSIEKQKNSDIYLGTLGVDGYNIGFDKNKFEYSIEVENNVSKINIKATTNTSTSTVVGSGEKELVVGDNKFTLTVTAENGSTQNYVINVKRLDVVKDTGTIKENPQTGVNNSVTVIVFILIAGAATLYITRKRNFFPKI